MSAGRNLISSPLFSSDKKTAVKIFMLQRRLEPTILRSDERPDLNRSAKPYDLFFTIFKQPAFRKNVAKIIDQVGQFIGNFPSFPIFIAPLLLLCYDTSMTKCVKTTEDLEKKLHRVLITPAGFDFFIAIHDFVKCIELNPSLIQSLSSRSKSNRDLKIPAKYESLKQIYQGLEDIRIETSADLGHSRYMVLEDLKKIRGKNLSECNTFWKKREVYRKMVNDIYDCLNSNLS